MNSDSKRKAPPAMGVRQKWADMPQKIQDKVEAYLENNVIKTETQSGGFSPGVAVRLYTTDDRCFFLKAIGTDINPSSVIFHRNEITINNQLPENAFAPRLLWSYDDAVDTEWVVLLFDNVTGENPATPWQDHDLERVMIAMNELSEVLTPSPLKLDAIPDASHHFSRRIHGWQRIQSGASSVHINQLDDWSKHHLDRLCDLEKKAPPAVAGDTLVHFDIRADNIVMNDDGVWFVDWPHAALGAKWLDAVLFAPGVAMQDGLLPEDLMQQHAACREADPDAITTAVVSLERVMNFRSRERCHRR